MQYSSKNKICFSFLLYSHKILLTLYRGLTVATDEFASNEALERTAYILDNMMINMDSAIPDIMDRVNEKSFFVVNQKIEI